MHGPMLASFLMPALPCKGTILLLMVQHFYDCNIAWQSHLLQFVICLQVYLTAWGLQAELDEVLLDSHMAMMNDDMHGF